MMSSKFYEEDSAGFSFVKWVKAMVRGPFVPCVSLRKKGLWKNFECVDCEDPAGLNCVSE